MFAIDYDGTIAGTNFAKSRWIRERLGRDVPPWRCDHTSRSGAMSEAEYERMAAEVYSPRATEEARPVPGAPEALRTLARHGPVYVVTHRTLAQIAAALRWLEARGLDGLTRDVLSSAGSSKLALTRRLGCRVLIDDDVRHLSGAEPDVGCVHLRYGMGRPPETRDGVLVCSTWEDAVEYALTQADHRGR